VPITIGVAHACDCKVHTRPEATQCGSRWTLASRWILPTPVPLARHAARTVEYEYGWAGREAEG
jgi:hypothetical protein